MSKFLYKKKKIGGLKGTGSNIMGDTDISNIADGTVTGAIESLDTNKADLVDGVIPANQLPSFVDDVIEGTINEDLTEFTATGDKAPLTPESGKIYVDTNKNQSYRWSGTVYASVGKDLALGETSSTAYAGDKGKALADKIGDTSITSIGDGTLTGAIETLNSNKLDKTGDSKDNTTTFTSSDTSTVSSWTDVPTLTSGETHASIFSKISQMVKNVRYLWKLMGTTDISSIGDGTMSGAISTLNENKLGKTANASSASKLSNTSAIGSATNPVYFNASGVPVAGTYSLNKTVPSDAVFTDTTYSNATTSVNGLMSSTDKSKLDGIAANANNYSLPTATSSVLGGVKVGSNITNSSGTISLSKSNVTSALGYTPPTANTDTKNTAGSTDTSSKIFLVGATSQAANPQTYSQDTAYVGTDGCLYSGGTKTSVVGHTHNYAGSSSAGGAATSANKLNTNAGSATNPVYFTNGVPVACSYSLNKTVPSNAVFTDTNTWRGIQNNLTSTSTSDSLSAYQGKLLNDKINGLMGRWFSEVVTSSNASRKIYANTAIINIEYDNKNSFGFVYERNSTINIIWGWNNLNLGSSSSSSGITITGIPGWSRLCVMDISGGGVSVSLT